MTDTDKCITHYIALYTHISLITQYLQACLIVHAIAVGRAPTGSKFCGNVSVTTSPRRGSLSIIRQSLFSVPNLCLTNISMVCVCEISWQWVNVCLCVCWYFGTLLTTTTTLRRHNDWCHTIWLSADNANWNIRISFISERLQPTCNK